VNPVTEHHFRVNELAHLWSLSRQTILRLFQNQPGVLKLGSAKYTALSIPESVASRVHQTLSGARPELENGRGRKTLKLT
jgi:hypothetical protein